MPSWSHDGQSIYFGSTRSGTSQIWKQSPQGGEPVQVTQHGGYTARSQWTGSTLIYSKTETFPATLCRVPVSGGEEVTVVRDLAYYGNFTVARDGIYFESATPGASVGSVAMFTPFSRPGATIEFLSFATGKVSRVMTIDRHAGHGFGVSPDGRTLLFGLADSFTEDLMLIENFR